MSKAFKASSFIEQHEMPQLWLAAEERRIPIMPLFVDRVDLAWTHLDRLQGLNSPDEPLVDIPAGRLHSELRRIAELIAEKISMA